MQGKFHLNPGRAPHLPHIPHSGAQWVELAVIVAATALFAFLIVERTVEMAGTATVVGSESQNAPASAYTIQRQETLKDAWLARGTSSPSIAYSVDRQEALKDAWLGRGTNSPSIAYSVDRQEALKDAWLARETSSPSIAYSVDRQEALKDAWLARGR